MANKLLVKGTLSGTSTTPQIQHLITNAWTGATVFNTQTGNYECLLDNVPAADYTDTPIRARVPGTSPLVTAETTARALGLIAKVLDGTSGGSYDPTTALRTDAFPAWAVPTTTYSRALRTYTSPTSWDYTAVYFHSDNTAEFMVNGRCVIDGKKFYNAGSGATCLAISVGVPVDIVNCDFGGNPSQAACSIRAPEVTFINNRNFATAPASGSTRSRGVFLELDNGDTKCRKFTVTYNYSIGSAGIRVQNMDDNTSLSVIGYNDLREINTLKGDNSREFKSAIQILNCPAIWLHIKNNQIISTKGVGNGEDQVNIYSAVGTLDKPLLIYDNYVEQAVSSRLDSGNNGFTGTGTTTDLSKSAGAVPAYVRYVNNQFVRCANACMNIAGGHNIEMFHNRMITYGLFEDGGSIGQQSAAAAIFDYYQTGASKFYENYVVNNLIGYYTWYKERRDGTTGIQATDNLHLPDPITLDTEYYERQLWEQKKVTNQFSVGNLAA